MYAPNLYNFQHRSGNGPIIAVSSWYSCDVPARLATLVPRPQDYQQVSTRKNGGCAADADLTWKWVQENNKKT